MLYRISIKPKQYYLALTWTYPTRYFRNAHPHSGRGFTVYTSYNETVMPLPLIMFHQLTGCTTIQTKSVI
jgi:hypothetical protein